jgi:hypothetical protein
MACFSRTEAMGRISIPLLVCAAPLEFSVHLPLGNFCNTSSSTTTSNPKQTFANIGGVYGVESRQYFQRI